MWKAGGQEYKKGKKKGKKKKIEKKFLFLSNLPIGKKNVAGLVERWEDALENRK